MLLFCCGAANLDDFVRGETMGLAVHLVCSFSVRTFAKTQDGSIVFVEAVPQ
jgi:hypothetical protein